MLAVLDLGTLRVAWLDSLLYNVLQWQYNMTRHVLMTEHHRRVWWFRHCLPLQVADITSIRDICDRIWGVCEGSGCVKVLASQDRQRAGSWEPTQLLHLSCQPENEAMNRSACPMGHIHLPGFPVPSHLCSLKLYLINPEHGQPMRTLCPAHLALSHCKASAVLHNLLFCKSISHLIFLPLIHNMLSSLNLTLCNSGLTLTNCHCTQCLSRKIHIDISQSNSLQNA